MLYSPLMPGLHDLVEMGNLVDVLWEEDYEEEEVDQEESAIDDGEIEQPPIPAEDVEGRGWVPLLGWWSSSSTKTKMEGAEEDYKTPSSPLLTHGSGSVHKQQGM